MGSGLDAINLHSQLQRGQDVLHFRLEDFWSQFAFSDPHLISKECNLQKRARTVDNMLRN